MTQAEARISPPRAGAAEALPAFAARGITKRYGGTLALDHIDLTLAAGQIHALVGENGAGKSTFLGALAGRVVPSEGEITVFGQPHVFGNPREARRLGIGTIYQELTIIPRLSAVANVFLGQPLSRAAILSEAAMRREFHDLCLRFDVSIRPDAIAGTLSTADQQMLEIMRGVRSGAELLLFDEPTTSLAPPEREGLFRVMRQLREQGKTMVLVSHNLEEVLALADTITVFRDGKLARSAPRADWTKATMVHAMVGHEVEEYRRVARAARPAGAAPLLTVKGVTLPGACEDISFSLQPGEILGIGGLVGSGRSSLLRALAGVEPKSRGEMIIEGHGTPWPARPRQSMRAGLALVPEDRKAQGLVLSMRAMDNIVMSNMGRVMRAGILSDSTIASASRQIAREFGYAEHRIGTIVRHLSGGNQQKVLLGKARFSDPKILMVDEPTRGIDIGAKDEIMSTLRALADQGMGIIVVSSDLEEVIQISDRILVMSHGRLVDEIDQSKGPATVSDILNSAFGVDKNAN
ncbi:sugar ABC transporter ATP-binding protein [Xinfangfangia sp. D13-10-4-6]|uniref:sugar ABC transporter ATP-binding protein n=1 Tax=Pseudogemmobacter hezensis TaxID=2737662 RepID=UPI0015568CD0|nr:sugar ABC transporter ATP-binding protein [Pseudogemmobacter hezensis]NPD14894.1 sugar ABC transporter ATP-binding protein [Pseudogemmobacter hezensis]